MAKRNYRKMSTEPEVDQTPVTEPETFEEEVQEEIKPEPVVGVVSGCGKLNIRKEPSLSGEVVYEALLKSELVIDLDKSTDEWYSVCAPAGIEGFCMKKFVELK
jgi:hypothetical protein